MTKKKKKDERLYKKEKKTSRSAMKDKKASHHHKKSQAKSERRKKSSTSIEKKDSRKHKKSKNYSYQYDSQNKKRKSSGSKKKDRNKPKKNSNKKKASKKTEIILSIICVILLFLIGLVIFALINYTKGEVISASMEPTLAVDDRVVISKKKEPQRFDMVVFYPPGNDEEKWVKRIIGLPGEKIEYFDDHLYVNGKEVEEPYLKSGKEKSKETQYTPDFDLSKIPGMKEGESKIPKDYYLVMGDNRGNSEDSRVIGLVNKDRIEGVVLFRYFPLGEFGSVYGSEKK